MKKIEALLYSSGEPVSIKIEEGNISEINSFTQLPNEDNKLYVAPGLFDNQLNGYLGVEFTDTNLTTENMLKVVRGLWKTGITTFLPTVITASNEVLLKAFANLAEACKHPEISMSIPGFHLEGPYISPVAGYRGAHTIEDIRLPNWDEFQKINEAAEGKIIHITIAPELDGAIEFTKKCVENNIVVALGHHNASSEVIKKAVDAGATTVTHLGNGCANTINRFENPFWSQLAEDGLMASIIVDGFHLQPNQVNVFLRSKGKERIILISDITMLAGMPPGIYEWDGKEVELTPEGAINLVKENCFAGASLPLLTGINNIIEFTGCSRSDAIDMATKNPTKLYSFDDRGEISINKRADLILFTIENNKIVIKETIVGGETVFSAYDMSLAV